MHRLRTFTSLDVSAVAGHHAVPAALLFQCKIIFSSPGQSPGRAIVLPPGVGVGVGVGGSISKMLKFYVKVFYVMGKALSGELSCPCDRSCLFYS